MISAPGPVVPKTATDDDQHDYDDFHFQLLNVFYGKY